MDNQNRHLERLLAETDAAFEQLKQDPHCDEFHQAYDEAKQALDGYLLHIREGFERRYRNF